jgi:hypothetical protein
MTVVTYASKYQAAGDIGWRGKITANGRTSSAPVYKGVENGSLKESSETTDVLL